MISFHANDLLSEQELLTSIVKLVVDLVFLRSILLYHDPERMHSCCIPSLRRQIPLHQIHQILPQIEGVLCLSRPNDLETLSSVEALLSGNVSVPVFQPVSRIKFPHEHLIQIAWLKPSSFPASCAIGAMVLISAVASPFPRVDGKVAIEPKKLGLLHHDMRESFLELLLRFALRS